MSHFVASVSMLWWVTDEFSPRAGPCAWWGGELNPKIPGPGLKKLPGGMWANWDGCFAGYGEHWEWDSWSWNPWRGGTLGAPVVAAQPSLRVTGHWCYTLLMLQKRDDSPGVTLWVGGTAGTRTQVSRCPSLLTLFITWGCSLRGGWQAGTA